MHKWLFYNHMKSNWQMELYIFQNRQLCGSFLRHSVNIPHTLNFNNLIIYWVVCTESLYNVFGWGTYSSGNTKNYHMHFLYSHCSNIWNRTIQLEIKSFPLTMQWKLSVYDLLVLVLGFLLVGTGHLFKPSQVWHLANPISLVLHSVRSHSISFIVG